MLWQICILLHTFQMVLTFYISDMYNETLSSVDENDTAWTYPELKSGLFEGDILLFENGPDGNALKNKYLYWPQKTVPYEINQGFSADDKKRIEEAMRHLESETCVKFVPRSGPQREYIVINNWNNGCYAYVGYRRGVLPVNLQTPGCMSPGTIQHELLHVLGLYHEQSRPDRDDYVTIYLDNVEPGQRHNFDKKSTNEVTTFDVEYDYKSVMHYPRDAFSRNGKNTIIAKDDPDLELGQRDGAAESDFEKIRKMYEC